MRCKEITSDYESVGMRCKKQILKTSSVRTPINQFQNEIMHICIIVYHYMYKATHNKLPFLCRYKFRLIPEIQNLSCC